MGWSAMSNCDFPDIDFDSRWIGTHGIGRFARELFCRLKFGGEIKSAMSPASPMDCIFITLRHLLRRRRIVFSPGYNAPIFGLDRYVLTVHDLNHIDNQEHGCLKKLYYELILKRACRKALKVLTVSEFSRRRIISWAEIEESRVVNVGNGVGEVFVPNGHIFTAGSPYFLMVSNRKPHKNEKRAIEAFASENIPPHFLLLITGVVTAELSVLIRKLGLTKRVRFVGSCTDIELAALYRGATGLLFVSLYEGFGLPIVEAMSCGTPVITSNVCSMPEVAGDAALIVDPYCLDEISNAIGRLCAASETLLQYYREKGIFLAAQYNWANVSMRVARELCEVQVSVRRIK